LRRRSKNAKRSGAAQSHTAFWSAVVTASPDVPPDVSPDEAPAELSRWKRILFSVLVLILVCGVLEVAASVGLRVFRGYDGSHLYQYEFDPYRNIHPTPNFVDHRGIRHNSVGFRRDGEVSVAKPTGTYRVFLMGASTAYGLGGLWPHLQREFAVLDNTQTISAYLEQQLQDSLPGVKVEVINAAVTSTWTHHHLIYLNQHILKYDPDLVLFLDGFNDFYQFEPWHDQFASYAYGMPSRVILGEPTLYGLAYANAWWLFRKSAAAHVGSRAGEALWELVRPRAPRTPIDVEASLTNVQRNFPANALKMHERAGAILRHEGIRTVFMMQPLLILERDRVGMPAIERALFEFNVESYRPGYEEYVKRATPFLLEHERAMAARVGATFMDLTTPFAGVEAQVYTDYAHLTPLGNRLLAERMLAHVLPGIRSDLHARDDAVAP
jgi:lysophospholipase L1-like esterase